ncbi:hypothetical protein DPMN_047956 [Dreissena polymorpha]|uniref:Uncharacterized protein n=1 Tax=Dreissena polymorpha TaxID=45954 RepID=A0A9D4HZM8_DREPO|nr:hypothetical protein DPMN_047956 [Dreissena polymorpha]
MDGQRRREERNPRRPARQAGEGARNPASGFRARFTTDHVRRQQPTRNDKRMR